MTPAEDPNIKRLHKLADAYWDAEAKAKRLRMPLDAHIQEMKRRGYSYPLLARESGFAQGTIQLIIAKQYRHVTKRRQDEQRRPDGRHPQQRMP